MHAPHLPLSAGEAVAIGLLTMIVVMVPLLWAAAEHFSTMTHVPGALWSVVWLAGTAVALIAGGKLLVLG